MKYCGRSRGLPLGQLFSFSIEFQPERPGESTEKITVLNPAFYATMPTHAHGMVTRTNVKKVSDRLYIVEGAKLHMPGQWLLKVKANINGTAQEFVAPYELKLQ